MAESSTKRPEMGEVATAEKDIDLFGGWMTRMENPDEVIRLESRGKGVRIYEELLRDGQVFSMLQARSLALQGCEWQVEPVSEQRRHVQEAEFIEKVLKDANYDALTGGQMQAIITGYKPVEVMWDASEGDTWVKEFRPRRPSRFVFDMQGNLRLLTVQNIFDGEAVPDRKFMTWSFGGFDHNPYGRGLGYQCFWPVFFKKNDIKFWLIFNDRFGSPIPVGKVPPGTDDAVKDKLLAAIARIQQETGIVIEDNQVIDFLEATRAGSGVNTYRDLIDYMDRAIAKVIVGHVITSEPGVAGTVAMAEIFKNLSRALLKSDADSLCETHNRSLVRWLIDYNFPSSSRGLREYPKVWRRTEPEEDLKALAERDKVLLVDMGMAERVSETYIADTYGLPLAGEGERTIGRPKAEAAPGEQGLAVRAAGTGAQNGIGAQFSECPHCHAQFADTESDTPDVIVEPAAQAAGPIMDEMIDRVRELVMGAGSLDEVRDGLLDLYGDIDPAELGGLMAQAMMLADIEGRYEVQHGD